LCDRFNYETAKREGRKKGQAGARVAQGAAGQGKASKVPEASAHADMWP